MAGRMVSNPLLNNYKKSQVDDLRVVDSDLCTCLNRG